MCLITDTLCIPFIYSNPLSPNQWPPLGNLPGWALCRRPRTWPLLWASGGGVLQAGASLMQEPSSPLPFLFHLRARRPFMSAPFQWPWEFPIFLCWVGSFWEFLAHLFLPLFFSLPPFHLFLHCSSPQGLGTRSIASFAVLSNAPQFSAVLSSTALLYIHIGGELLMVRKVVSFWKGSLFHNCLDNTFVC